MMRVNLLGTRGSHPTSSQENMHFGGSTPCIQIFSGEDSIILDAGTGIIHAAKPVNRATMSFHILLTHLHMDHIQGLGFFEPLFDPDCEVHIWGPTSSRDSLEDRLKRFLSPPLFPVSLRHVPCKLEIHELADEQFSLPGFQVTSRFVSHPGPTIGYRISSGTETVTYIPDHEPVIGSLELYPDESWLSGFDLALQADLLIHDGQYTADKYMKRVGWGHSSMHHTAELAAKCQVKRLIIFHHDPNHSDENLREIFDEFNRTHQYPFPIELAVQGAEIVVNSKS